MTACDPVTLEIIRGAVTDIRGLLRRPFQLDDGETGVDSQDQQGEQDGDADIGAG